VLEENEDGEDLGGMESGAAATLACAAAQQLTLPLRFEALPKGVYRTKQVEYTHSDVSSAG
jgi:hypothetical protein